MTAIMEGGFKGVKFKRGHVICEEDIPELLNIGKSHIFILDPEADVYKRQLLRARLYLISSSSPHMALKYDRNSG